MKLAGKVAFITGGTRGIGHAVAVRLAQEGASVVILGRDAARGQVALEAFKGLSGPAVFVRADVSQPEDVRRAVHEALNAFGRIDILVNNAAIIRRESFLEHTFEAWQEVIAVNLHGVFLCCKEIVPLMIRQGGGRIVNITSVAGKIGDIASAPSYGASKGAVNAFTKALARELAQYNITVNAVAPHAIETEMSAQWSEERRQRIIEAIPLKRLGRPEEVAEAVLFLVSPGAEFITGEILDVNGGFLMD